MDFRKFRDRYVVRGGLVFFFSGKVSVCSIHINMEKFYTLYFIMVNVDPLYSCKVFSMYLSPKERKACVPTSAGCSRDEVELLL